MKKHFLLFSLLLFITSSCGLKQSVEEAMELGEALSEEFDLKGPSVNYQRSIGSSLTIGVRDYPVGETAPEVMEKLAQDIHDYVVEEFQALGKVNEIVIWFVPNSWEEQKDSDFVFRFEHE